MSLWQTHDWQNMLQKSGQVEVFFEIDGIYIEKRRISFGKYALFILGVTKSISEGSIQKIQKLCKEHKCVFVQYETLNYNSQKSISIPMTQNGYYKKFIPPYTCVIDLNQSLSDILAMMKQKGRYNIRLAEKKGVVIEQVDAHPYNIEKFYNLVAETTSRNEFSGNTQQYYEIFLKYLKNSQLFFAYYEEQIIAAGIFVVHEDMMIYYYGASSSKFRNIMAPYLLQWKVIEHAKKRGCKIYDFLGVAGPSDLNSSLRGVTDFKMKLSPNRKEVSESFIWINNKTVYVIIHLFKKLFRK